MSTTSDFYFGRAAECAAEADAAVLDQVRERCLRSAAAWRAMAERSAKSEEMRVEIARTKAI
jgi:hypothetical protein